MIYVIGDIHGCLEPLMKLMDLVKLTPDDHLIFLGDYINRGPDPKGVIDYLLTLKGNITFLKGNHEQMFLDYLNGKEKFFFLLTGGDATLRSFLKKKAVASPALVEATFWLGNAAALFRVLPPILPAGFFELSPVAGRLLLGAFGLSGLIALAGAVCLAANLWRTARPGKSSAHRGN